MTGPPYSRNKSVRHPSPRSTGEDTMTSQTNLQLDTNNRSRKKEKAQLENHPHSSNQTQNQLKAPRASDDGYGPKNKGSLQQKHQELTTTHNNTNKTSTSLPKKRLPPHLISSRSSMFKHQIKSLLYTTTPSVYLNISYTPKLCDLEIDSGNGAKVASSLMIIYFIKQQPSALCGPIECIYQEIITVLPPDDQCDYELSMQIMDHLWVS
ncbi:hypothetical protein MTR_3g061980 [Medicago truncatula]|uniref:Uncharacterized protein n=1 Tax=Medicago truncatula TaxID=3880 RepID=G7J293_MEDTR|nr:hypothetical protein MTR_3g061980 [Medicago truncatula]